MGGRSHNEAFFLREPAVQLVALKDVAEQASINTRAIPERLGIDAAQLVDHDVATVHHPRKIRVSYDCFLDAPLSAVRQSFDLSVHRQLDEAGLADGKLPFLAFERITRILISDVPVFASVRLDAISSSSTSSRACPA